jgi:hypothetical protein
MILLKTVDAEISKQESKETGDRSSRSACHGPRISWRVFR